MQVLICYPNDFNHYLFFNVDVILYPRKPYVFFMTFNIFRISAKVAAGINILFWLAMFFNHVFNPHITFRLHSLEMSEMVQLVLMWISVIGMALAMKWELIGGTISLLAFVVLASINPVVIQFPYIVSPALSVFVILVGGGNRLGGLNSI